MKYKKSKFIIIFFILAILLSGCKAQDVSQKKGYTIVTSFYPIYIATMNITKDIPDVTVINMTKAQTGCLHDYQLSPQDLITLESADVFLINGAGMESFMDKVIKQRPNLKIIEATKGIELLKDKESGEINPHVWVSISGAIEEVKNLTKQLSEADKEHAEQYNKNAEEYMNQLEALKEKMHFSLDNAKRKDIITFHEAFPYFAKEFNLNIKAVVERDPGEDPSAGELAKTIDLIKESNVLSLFAEPQYSSKAANTIANETGATVYILDPAATGRLEPNAYINAMENNLKVLEEALNHE